MIPNAFDNFAVCQFDHFGPSTGIIRRPGSVNVSFLATSPSIVLPEEMPAENGNS